MYDEHTSTDCRMTKKLFHFLRFKVFQCILTLCIDRLYSGRYASMVDTMTNILIQM